MVKYFKDDVRVNCLRRRVIGKGYKIGSLESVIHYLSMEREDPRRVSAPDEACDRGYASALLERLQSNCTKNTLLLQSVFVFKKANLSTSFLPLLPRHEKMLHVLV